MNAPTDSASNSASSLPFPVLRILVVDDHELVRDGIIRMLADEADLKVVGEAASGEECLQVAAECQPDIVLMDARMPGIGGVEATRQLIKQFPKLRVIGMSSIDSGMVPSQMLRYGAMSFITKSLGVEEMLKAIDMARRDARYVSAEVATKLALGAFEPEVQLFERLSSREFQIAQLLSDGKKASQIAEMLQLSPKTVYSYRYRIFEKLGIHNDVELTILAVKYGLTDDAQDRDYLTASEG